MGKFESILLSPTTDSQAQRIAKMIEYTNSLKLNGEQIFEAEEGVMPDDYNGIKVSIVGTDISFGYFYRYDRMQETCSYVKVGNNYVLGPTYNGNNYQGTFAMNVYSYIDENFILLEYADVHYYRHKLSVALANTNSKQLLGYSVTSDTGSYNGYRDISELTFISPDDLIRTYTFANMFPYQAENGYLDFLSHSYLVNSGNYRSFTSSFIKACSTMPLIETASLPGTLGPHIALGVHLLAPIDTETEEEEVTEE